MLLLATLLSAVLVALSSAPAANAHDGTPSPTCTGLQVTAWAYNGNTTNGVRVVIDGEEQTDTFGASYDRTFPWSATEDHVWEVWIDQGDGSEFDRYFTDTWQACEEPPTTEVQIHGQPTLTDVCGPAYGEPVLPAADGFTWTVDESGVRDGVGTVVVTATLLPGSVWVGGGTDPKQFPLPVTNEPCDVPTAVEGTPNVIDECGPGYVVQLPDVTAEDGYRFTVVDAPGGEGTVVVTATLLPGFVWSDGGTAPRDYPFEVSSEPCDTPVTGLALADVTVTPATCAAPGSATPGEPTRASWTVTDVPAAGGVATFVATADEGAAFEAGLPGVSSDLTTRTFTIDVPAAGGDLCTIAPPPVQPPTDATPPTTPQSPPTPPQSATPTLPQTGFDVSPLLALGALLAMAGAALVARRVRAHG